MVVLLNFAPWALWRYSENEGQQPTTCIKASNLHEEHFRLEAIDRLTLLIRMGTMSV